MCENSYKDSEYIITIMKKNEKLLAEQTIFRLLRAADIWITVLEADENKHQVGKHYTYNSHDKTNGCHLLG